MFPAIEKELEKNPFFIAWKVNSIYYYAGIKRKKVNILMVKKDGKKRRG